MSQQDAFAEAVFFFEGDDISVEMHYAESCVVNQSATLEFCGEPGAAPTPSSELGSRCGVW
jgi:hypothetical protein